MTTPIPASYGPAKFLNKMGTDWRVGLTATPTVRTHQLFSLQARIIGTLPSGSYGIDDPDGVLVLQVKSAGPYIGLVLLESAKDWRTS